MVQIIRSNPKFHFDIKKNVPKCLNIIFRDMVNYSRESIRIVLQSTWKLLIIKLSVYTETVGYGKSLKYTEQKI
jgi:hypothetical protein